MGSTFVDNERRHRRPSVAVVVGRQPVQLVAVGAVAATDDDDVVLKLDRLGQADGSWQL